MECVYGLLACLAAFSQNHNSGVEGKVRPWVTERQGAVIYHDQQSRECALTPPEQFTQPELSPDGKTVAVIQIEKPGDPGMDEARTSLWIVDVASGSQRKLLASTPGGGMTEMLAAMWHPQFSLNGGFVYVAAEAWTTSSAIHQVSVTTGAHRYVTDGELLLVIRRGRYAGYLAVSKHKYPANPELGATNPVYIVRPDGKWAIEVPGSASDEGDKSLPRWLRKNGG